MLSDIKVTVILDVILCNLIDSYHCFRESCWIHLQGRRFFYPEDGSSTYEPDYSVTSQKTVNLTGNITLL